MAENLNIDELNKQRLKILGDIGRMTQQINAFNNSANKDAKVGNELNRQRSKLARELLNVNVQIRKEQRGLHIEALNSTKSLGSLYSKLKDLEKNRVNMMMTAGNLSNVAIERGNTLAELNQKISQLTLEQSLEREILQEQFDNEIKKLERQRGIHGEIIDNLKKQNKVAVETALLTENQKDFLESQLKTYADINLGLSKILETVDLFTSSIKGTAGLLLITSGFIVDKFTDVNKQLGTTINLLDDAAINAGILSFVFDNTASTVKSLASEFGDVSAATLSLQTNVGLIANNMGISNTDAVSLLGSFSRLNDGSSEIASNMISTSREFAIQNGIIPVALMDDLADAAEQFSLYGRDGGENILRAAAYAQKLGVNLKLVTGIADTLLDFESSITKELELGAMLGKNINLNQARQLAYSGDIEGATKATLTALGGIDAFNRMDYFQKKATAELLGTSVSELDKMVNNQEKAQSMGAVINEEFSKMGEFINTALNDYLGTGLKGLGGMVIAVGQLNEGFNVLGISVMGAVKGTGQVLLNLLKMVAAPLLGGLKKLGTSISDSSVGRRVGSIQERLFAGVGNRQAPSIAPNAGQGATRFMDGLSKINTTAILKGAAAMLVVASAVFVFGKALQQFSNIGLAEVAAGIGSIVALTGAVVLLGAVMSSGAGTVAILAGAAAMLIISSSILVLGIALQSIGVGFEMLASGISMLTPTLMGIGDTISSILLYIPSISLLSLSLMGLAGALTAVGIAGIAALPAMLAIQATGAIADTVSGVIGGTFGESENMTQQSDMALLVSEIKGLRSDLNSGKIAVYMDGEKVTARVSNVVSRIGSNSYSLK